MSIYEKLLRVQLGLKAPKSQWNDFGKYNYRNCEDILEAAKPLLDKEKLLLIIKDELTLIGDRYYIKAVVTLKDLEELIEIEVTAYAREEESKKGMDGSQVTGASSSYARKYALNGLFLIDDTKDSDATNKDDKATVKAPTTKAPTKASGTLSDAQIKRLFAIGKSAGYDSATVIDHIRKRLNKNPDELTKPEYDQVCKGYEDKENENK